MASISKLIIAAALTVAIVASGCSKSSKSGAQDGANLSPGQSQGQGQAKAQPKPELEKISKSESLSHQDSKEAPKCEVLSFHHRKDKNHSNADQCLRHRNLISLGTENFDKKSVCIRVNGKAVAHEPLKGKPGQFVIGALAGPESVITAQFCTGGAKCKSDCKVPKDEFLAAIGAEGSAGDSGVWVAGKRAPAQEEQQLQKELADFKGLLDGSDSTLPVYPDWNRDEAAKAASCGA